MQKPNSVKCENCMFYANGKDKGVRICVFNPPNTDGGILGFPKVEPNWWCGRFRPTDNLTAVEWVAWQKGLIEDARATNL